MPRKLKKLMVKQKFSLKCSHNQKYKPKDLNIKDVLRLKCIVGYEKWKFQ